MMNLHKVGLNWALLAVPPGEASLPHRVNAGEAGPSLSQSGTVLSMYPFIQE